MGPLVLLATTIGPKESAERPNWAFGLSVRSWVAAQGQTDCDPQAIEESPPYSLYKLGAAIRQDLLWDTVAVEHVLE